MELAILRRFIIYTITLLMMGWISVSNIYAQADVMFTKYQFNSLIFNPAYAGSKEYMTLNVLHRSQWLGIKGGPSAQTFTIHSPTKGFDRLGMGAAIFNQNVGTTQTMGANLSYAYRIRLGENPSDGTIAIGIQGGVTNWRANFKKIETDQPEDQSFLVSFPSLWLPNVGAGVYYYSKHYYFGISAPNIIEHNLRKRTGSSTSNRVAKTFRHYYAVLGGAIPFNGDDIVFKPSALFKTVALLSRFKNENNPYKNYGTPMEMTLDFSVLFYKTLWAGIAYRTTLGHFSGVSSHDSIDGWVAYYFESRMYVGVAYDYTLTKIKSPAKASFEVSLGYDFNTNRAKTYSPRYF